MTDLAAGLLLSALAGLVLAVYPVTAILDSRGNGRLLRDGVRVPAVVTRLGGPTQFGYAVEVEYTPAGATGAVRRWLYWDTGHPVPAVGESVAVLHLSGRRGRAAFEATVRYRPSL